MKASKQRKMARAIVSNKGLHHKESQRITCAQEVAYENRMLRTAKMFDKRFQEIMKSRRSLTSWA